MPGLGKGSNAPGPNPALSSWPASLNFFANDAVVELVERWSCHRRLIPGGGSIFRWSTAKPQFNLIWFNMIRHRRPAERQRAGDQKKSFDFFAALLLLRIAPTHIHPGLSTTVPIYNMLPIHDSVPNVKPTWIAFLLIGRYLQSAMDQKVEGRVSGMVCPKNFVNPLKKRINICFPPCLDLPPHKSGQSSCPPLVLPESRCRSRYEIK